MLCGKLDKSQINSDTRNLLPSDSSFFCVLHLEPEVNLVPCELMASHYDVLGVSRTATDEDVKAAYRAKAKLFHPDVKKSKNLGNSGDDGDDEFKLVNEAYSILGNPVTRRLYDQGVSGDALSSAAGNSSQTNTDYGGRRYGRRGNVQTKFHTKTDKYASLNVQQSNNYYKKFVESRGTMDSSSTGSTSNAGAGSTGYSSNRANVNALGRKAQRQKTRLNFVFVGIPFFMVVGFWKYYGNNSQRRRYR